MRKKSAFLFSQDVLPQAIQFIKSKVGGRPFPETAIVLGSGMGHVVQNLAQVIVIPYKNIPGFLEPSVPGHAGRLVIGHSQGTLLAVLQGRTHFYEGYSMEQIVFPIHVLKQMGIRNLILSSAVGGISASLKPGDLVLVKDHMNFMGQNPLRGSYHSDHSLCFSDLTDLYSKDLRYVAKKAARSMKLKLSEGIYLAVCGPSYDTPAEIKAFKKWGADMVGMSMIPEAITAHQKGIRVLAIAMVANKAAGLSGKPLSHHDVLKVAQQAEKNMSSIILKTVDSL